jgi:thiol-disulfide isomerase/thioredoxin
MNKFIKKRIEKYKKQSLFNKILDIVLVLLIIMMIIPGTRKELMTYASKLRMVVSSVNESEAGKNQLEGKTSLLIVDEEGEEYTLNDFEDKPVFINYWATWCPPCRAEMPTLQKLYNKYEDQVHFLFVSREPFATTTQYLTENEYSLPVYQIKSRPSGSLKYQVLPTSLLISSDNQLVFKKKGAVNWFSNDIRSIFEKQISR